MLAMQETAYGVKTLSKIERMKFSRNNGRNSKNIQMFPRVPPEVQRKLPARQVAPVRIQLKCPTAEAAASAVVTMTMVPETRDPESVWYDHECKEGSKECKKAPVYLGTQESISGCTVVIGFHPKKVWRYNHAMKKNLGRRREFHCIMVSLRGCLCPIISFTCA